MALLSYGIQPTAVPSAVHRMESIGVTFLSAAMERTTEKTSTLLHLNAYVNGKSHVQQFEVYQ